MKLICSLFITFLKIGAFTFGGGYAMIALLENEFVERKKWIEKDDFLNMVAIAESTPGSRIHARTSCRQQCDLHWLQNCRICGCNHVHTCCLHSIFLCNLWYLAVL